MNGPQCLQPFLAFLRWGCGPRLAAEQYMLRLPFCCCTAKNTRAKPAPGLAACLAAFDMDGEMFAPMGRHYKPPPQHGMLPVPLAGVFLLLHGGAVAVSEEEEVFSVCLK